jgi:hypothetical protein
VYQRGSITVVTRGRYGPTSGVFGGGSVVVCQRRVTLHTDFWAFADSWRGFLPKQVVWGISRCSSLWPPSRAYMPPLLGWGGGGDCWGGGGPDWGAVVQSGRLMRGGRGATTRHLRPTPQLCVLPHSRFSRCEGGCVPILYGMSGMGPSHTQTACDPLHAPLCGYQNRRPVSCRTLPRQN